MASKKLDPQTVLEQARRILQEESRAISAKEATLGTPFVRLVEVLLELNGKVVILVVYVCIMNSL